MSNAFALAVQRRRIEPTASLRLNRSGFQHLEHEIGDRLTAWHLDLVRHAGWNHHHITWAGRPTHARTSARARRIGHDLSAIPLPWLHELRSFHASATHDHRSPGLNDENVSQ